jgi:hypothetical protein
MVHFAHAAAGLAALVPMINKRPAVFQRAKYVVELDRALRRNGA